MIHTPPESGDGFYAVVLARRIVYVDLRRRPGCDHTIYALDQACLTATIIVSRRMRMPAVIALRRACDVVTVRNIAVQHVIYVSRVTLIG